MWLGPNVPGWTASASRPQSQAEREPSRIGSRSAWNVPAPSAVLQVCACSSVTCGMTEMSA